MGQNDLQFVAIVFWEEEKKPKVHYTLCRPDLESADNRLVNTFATEVNSECCFKLLYMQNILDI